MHAWEAHDLTLTRRARLHWSGAPELLGVDLDAILEPPVHVEPDVRVPGIRVWILMQLDRYQRPETYGGSAAAPLSADAHGHQGLRR
jgi:hypothetical protein